MGAHSIEITPLPFMLSRVADSLYWMGRYLERAEHTARVINVYLDLMLDQSEQAAAQHRQHVLASLDLPIDFDKAHTDYNLVQWLTFALDNANAVRVCIGAARENARQVREQISTEMWEQINQIYLFIEQVDMDAMWAAEPQEFYQNVKQGVHLFTGVTDSTMTHGQGWHFIQAGRYLERAIATSQLVDVYFSPGEYVPAVEAGQGRMAEHLLWLGVLRSCTAFEAYCKIYTADLDPRCILEFLLLNSEFPHSVSYAVRNLQRALQGIAEATQSSRAERAYRRAGRLQADLQYGQIDEILEGNLHPYFVNIQRQCTQIHDAIYQSYITYPIEGKL
ncbi:MAG: alpha-E domain-containing protein [Caldilineaceae bacterium]